MTHLFLFTIGPVQSFIEQARKTRDLRNGSLLIAWMIAKGYRFVINTFKQSHNAEPIFPALPEKDENYYGLPNRFLIGLNTENSNYIEEIGEQIQSYILDEFHSLAMTTLTGEMKKWNGKTLNIPLQEYKYQLESQWEMYWTGMKIENRNYVNAYRKIEGLLGAIKNTRSFAQLQNEKSRKCSLSGERDALFIGVRKDDHGRIRTPAYIYHKASTILTGSDNPQLSVNEGLSAIGFVKRYVSIYDYAVEFPSTAGIALMSWKKIAQQYAYQTYLDFNKKILTNREDDQLFYEENLTDSYLEKNGLNYLRKYNFEERILPLKTIKSIIHQHKKGVKKTSYYALLSFDGDRMGKWMNGDNLLDENQLLDFHQKFARCLKGFAKSASEKLESNEFGKPVYAGGDDFIGFITLQHVFDALKSLRLLFEESVNQHPELVPFKKESESFSFSGGLVIAHYKTPLREVIRTAKEMEKLAKDTSAGNRNALAIKILKHAGETEIGYIKWGDEVDVTKNLDLIKYLVKGMQKKDISRKFIQVLGTEFMELLGIHNARSLFPEAEKAEITRIVKRSCNTNLSSQAKTKYAEKVNILHNTCTPLTNFLSILKIIDFINRETYAD